MQHWSASLQSGLWHVTNFDGRNRLLQEDSKLKLPSGRKSCAITTAKRLGMFLGDDRIKDKGLNCHYVIARTPEVSSLCWPA